LRRPQARITLLELQEEQQVGTGMIAAFVSQSVSVVLNAFSSSWTLRFAGEPEAVPIEAKGRQRGGTGTAV
jgi:hypothetical protein